MKSKGLFGRHVLLLLLLLLSSQLNAGTIVYGVESPAGGATYFGIANLRGWAISEAGIDRVELYIDGEYRTNIPMGASRGDVANAYPSYPNAGKSGFSMAYNYGLRNGKVDIEYRIYDNDGAMETITRTVTAIKFGSQEYLNQDAEVDYSDASFSTSVNEVYIEGMKINGDTYNATLAWDPESQQLMFTEIN